MRRYSNFSLRLSGLREDDASCSVVVGATDDREDSSKKWMLTDGSIMNSGAFLLSSFFRMRLALEPLIADLEELAGGSSLL